MDSTERFELVSVEATPETRLPVKRKGRCEVNGQSARLSRSGAPGSNGSRRLRHLACEALYVKEESHELGNMLILPAI